jgi:hypothetical protein
MRQRRKDTIRRAASRGAAWLDMNVPGWSRKIKRRQLQMENGTYCILGQIDEANILGYDNDPDNGRGYEHALRQLGITEDAKAERLGFILPVTAEGVNGAQYDEAYEFLTEAWRDELKARPR